MAREVIFGQVLEQLMKERYRRNRAALADILHMSPSSLSQYVRGRATPSLEVLVHLAEIFDVSLDYLVLGQERTASSPELGYLTAHLEAHMRNVEERNATMHDLVSRIAAQASTQLAELVRSVAEKLVSENSHIAGTLTPHEVAALERCDAHTRIVMPDLSTEVLVLQQEGVEDTAAPGFFARVIVENLLEGGCYEYIVPQRARLRHMGNLLRQEVIRLSKLDPAIVDRRLQIRYAFHGCIPGFVIHHLVLERLHQRAGHLRERIARFIYPDPNNDTMGYLATITPASPSSQHYSLLTKEDVPHVMEEFDLLKQTHCHRKVTVPVE
jgi:transcriptional regulator with XRE-family HTH domain